MNYPFWAIIFQECNLALPEGSAYEVVFIHNFCGLPSVPYLLDEKRISPKNPEQGLIKPSLQACLPGKFEPSYMLYKRRKISNPFHQLVTMAFADKNNHDWIGLQLSAVILKARNSLDSVQISWQSAMVLKMCIYVRVQLGHVLCCIIPCLNDNIPNSLV